MNVLYVNATTSGSQLCADVPPFSNATFIPIIRLSTYNYPGGYGSSEVQQTSFSSNVPKETSTVIEQGINYVDAANTTTSVAGAKISTTEIGRAHV